MVGVVVSGMVAKLATFEWMVLTLTIAAVVVTEAVNTAVEFLADAAVPEDHPLIRTAKDVAAAAVLLASVAAVIVGMLLFGPKLG